MTAWWQHAVLKSGTLTLSREGCSLEAGGRGDPRNDCTVPDPGWQYTLSCSLEAEGQGDPRNDCSVPDRGCQHAVPSLYTVVLQCFDAVGWVKEWRVKSQATTIPDSLLLI